MKSVASIVTELAQGTTAVIPRAELEQKLASGKRLKIKFGIDPTATELHIGHAVVFAKLRQFQELGHEIILLIGDFTAQIGDPTGRSKARPPLTEEEINKNFVTYLEQIKPIIDTSKITVRRNSEWLKKLSSSDWIKLCSKVTVSRIIERDDFAQRLSLNQPIGMHELLYPIMQGYDSVALQADVELGGNDQMFNIMMGRFLQEQFNLPPQIVITTPLLPGLDGSAKMSKSMNNTIALTEPADQAFGKLMSISDDLMWLYYQILLHYPPEKINELKLAIGHNQQHPMDLKKAMAAGIVEKFWGKEQAQEAQKTFEHLFQKRDFGGAQEISINTAFGSETTLAIIDLLKKLNTVESSSAARRLIEAGAVTINGTKVTDVHFKVTLEPEMQIKVGKHKFFKITP
jgi:tyrosyl-tRNA synthetase